MVLLKFILLTLVLASSRARNPIPVPQLQLLFTGDPHFAEGWISRLSTFGSAPRALWLPRVAGPFPTVREMLQHVGTNVM